MPSSAAIFFANYCFALPIIANPINISVIKRSSTAVLALYHIHTLVIFFSLFHCYSPCKMSPNFLHCIQLPCIYRTDNIPICLLHRISHILAFFSPRILICIIRFFVFKRLCNDIPEIISFEYYLPGFLLYCIYLLTVGFNNFLCPVF